MKFGDILRELLEEQEISQKDAAKELNVAPSTLGNYVRNLREPDYETLKNIADYFQVSTDYLLDYHKDTPRVHEEEKLLKIYNALSPNQKKLFLDQGTLLMKYNKDTEDEK